MRRIPIFLVPAVALLFTGVAAGQSLADVARAEEARRKTVKGQAKVYTNETLRGGDGGDPGIAPAPPLAAKPVPPPASEPATSGASDSAKDEKYWRERLSNARDAVKRSQTFADALQSQINGLYTEFVNMSDPAQRAVIEQKRLAAIAEQDRLKADIARQTKAIAEIEDEARRANVPAGWLR